MNADSNPIRPYGMQSQPHQQPYGGGDLGVDGISPSRLAINLGQRGPANAADFGIAPGGDEYGPASELDNDEYEYLEHANGRGQPGAPIR